MKTAMLFRPIWIFAVIFITVAGCEKDKHDDPEIKHSGDEWVIDSVNWNVVDQDFMGSVGQTVKSGTSYYPGSFYLKNDGGGSFEYDADVYHREGIFSYTINSDHISINHLEQNLSTNFSQKVVSYSGTITGARMEFDGTETEQTTSSQFVFTGEFYLTKK